MSARVRRDFVVLISLLALISLWASLRPSTPPAHQWEESWKDELVFTSSFHWAFGERMLIERDHYRLTYYSCSREGESDHGFITRDGDRLRLHSRTRGVANWRIEGRAGHLVLKAPPADRFNRTPFKQDSPGEPRSRPIPRALTGTHLSIHGVCPGQSEADLNKLELYPAGLVREEGSVRTYRSGDEELRVTLLGGRVTEVSGRSLELNGHTVIDPRSSTEDVEVLTGKPWPQDSGLAVPASGLEFRLDDFGPEAGRPIRWVRLRIPEADPCG